MNIRHVYKFNRLADLGAPRAPLPARTPERWSRTNPNFAQTQTSNKPKLRTNPNFEQTKKFLALGGLRIIRPWGIQNNPALGGLRIIRP